MALRVLQIGCIEVWVSFWAPYYISIYVYDPDKYGWRCMELPFAFESFEEAKQYGEALARVPGYMKV